VRALLSVSDKRGIVEFARALVGLGFEIVSTGGTAEALRQGGVPVVPIERVTGFPEMMDGRVKTLHPKVHGGLLARRGHAGDAKALKEHDITPIDLVAVNLYPFRQTIAKPETTFEQAIEHIDIGGPSMLRSAAKNHESVLVVVDPDDYPKVIATLREGSLTPGESPGSPGLRRELAAKVFAHTAAYDATIADYLTRSGEALPATLTLILERRQALRYGENPHQRAALYATDEARGIRELVQHHGKELSFNNLLDVDAAVAALAPWDDRPACVIIKHTTPCGIALGATPAEAYTRALDTDRTSAFGSVIAFNTVVDRAAAEAMRDLFVEVVVAPRYHDDALAVYREKKNLRVVELPLPRPTAEPAWDFKRIRGGFLVQDRFHYGGEAEEARWKVVTKRAPSGVEWRDLRFAWAAVATVKSNAILLAKAEAAIGIGAGQMSRVDASFLAVHKARQQGFDPAGAALASDAFFPFRDGVDEAAAAGVAAIIQPGGSVRDAEVIAAADERGLAMVFTGVRQFRH